jgi:hypothetical protein
MTFDEFVKRFSTKEQCRECLFSIRWPDGFVCPKCGHTRMWPVGDLLYECQKCGHQTSVTAGIIFQDTRKPLRVWFTAIWCITTQKTGASATGLMQVLGLKQYQTAWTWLHKIRKAMVSPERTKLTGTVEVDETYIGGEESAGKRGRGTENKTLVAVAVKLDKKRYPARIRLSVIQDASEASLKPFVTSDIEEGGNCRNGRLERVLPPQ